MDDSIPRAIAKLKNEFMNGHDVRSMILSEIVPLSHSITNTAVLPISQDILQSLHKFAAANPIYVRSYETEVMGITCKVYEGDINSYWLSSKKYDTSYQPFYPTWMLSAFALAHGAKSLGFTELVDVGSGDGRIAYCGRLLGMDSYGIEIDSDLARLQNSISSETGVMYNVIEADATRFDYKQLKLSKPMFFISGLPEMGEMLANSVIRQAMSIKYLDVGFNLMGSHKMKSLSRDQTGWGWGSVIANYGLEHLGTVTLPTPWTADQSVDAAYVYTRVSSGSSSRLGKPLY
jgi:hypothetical protein